MVCTDWRDVLVPKTFHLMRAKTCATKSLFNWTSLWTPEKRWKCCSARVDRMSNLCSQIQKSDLKLVQPLRILLLRHLLKCFGTDLPAAPETLTSTDLWSLKTLLLQLQLMMMMTMMMEQMNGDRNRERDLEGCHGYNRRHDPFTANQHRNTEPVHMDRVFG